MDRTIDNTLTTVCFLYIRHTLGLPLWICFLPLWGPLTIEVLVIAYGGLVLWRRR